MYNNRHIHISLDRFISESKAHPFTRTIRHGKEYGKDVIIYDYLFNVNGVDLKCVIYPNLWKKDFYEVAFAPVEGTVHDRTGKDLGHMNSVLKTVAECMKDFIDSMDKVRILAFQTEDRTRQRAYVRFFKNHPYFQNHPIDDSFENSGFVEIHTDKNTGDMLTERSHPTQHLTSILTRSGIPHKVGDLSEITPNDLVLSSEGLTGHRSIKRNTRALLKQYPDGTPLPGKTNRVMIYEYDITGLRTIRQDREIPEKDQENIILPETSAKDTRKLRDIIRTINKLGGQLHTWWHGNPTT
jgi:hypothetical protein